MTGWDCHSSKTQTRSVDHHSASQRIHNRDSTSTRKTKGQDIWKIPKNFRQRKEENGREAWYVFKHSASIGVLGDEIL